MSAIDLGLPPGFIGGDAGHINDQGEILVNFNTASPNGMPAYIPFVWKERSGLVKLPVPPGYDNVRAVALNNRGTVLLEARPSDPSLDPVGYLIVNGVLKQLPGPPEATSTSYYGLNDKGWLVGVAEINWGNSRGFVALPVR